MVFILYLILTFLFNCIGLLFVKFVKFSFSFLYLMIMPIFCSI